MIELLFRPEFVYVILSIPPTKRVESIQFNVHLLKQWQRDSTKALLYKFNFTATLAERNSNVFSILNYSSSLKESRNAYLTKCALLSSQVLSSL